MTKAVLFWSAGKDSAMALNRLQQDPEMEIMALVTTLNERYRRISMHGISESMLDRQSGQLGIPLIKMWVPDDPDNSSYEKAFLKLCRELKNEGIDTLVFGDIFLDDLRMYRENLAHKAGLKVHFPLWKIPADQLVAEFTNTGFRAITCCVQSNGLGMDWIGRQLGPDFFSKLPAGADPCGENGEYHTFCYDGPVFNRQIAFKTGEIVFKPVNIRQSDKTEESGFFYLDIL